MVLADVTTLSTEDHVVAVTALLTTATAHPYSLQAIADQAAADNALPTSYCEVYVTRRVAEGGRFGGISDTGAWRVQVRAIGTDADNAQTIRDRVGAALEDRVVTVDGVESTPMLRSTSEDPIRSDGGWYSGLSEFTYRL